MDWRNTYGYFLIPTDPARRGDAALARRLYELVVHWGEVGALSEPSVVLARQHRTGRECAVLFAARSRSQARLPLAAGLRKALDQIAPVSLERAYPEKIRAWARKMTREICPARTFLPPPAEDDDGETVSGMPSPELSRGLVQKQADPPAPATRPSAAVLFRHGLPKAPGPMRFWSMTGAGRQAWLIALVALLLIGPALWATWTFIRPRQEAVAEVRLRTMPQWSASASPQGDPYRASYETYAALLRSSVLIDRVLERPAVGQTRWFTGEAEPGEPAEVLPPAERLRRDLRVVRRSPSPQASVHLRAFSAEDAQVVLAAVLEEWLAMLADRVDVEAEAAYERMAAEHQALTETLQEKRSAALRLQAVLGTAEPESLIAQRRLWAEELEAKLADARRRLALAEWRNAQANEAASRASAWELDSLRMEIEAIREDLARQETLWREGFAQAQELAELQEEIRQGQQRSESLRREAEAMRSAGRIVPRLEVLAPAYASRHAVGDWRWLLSILAVAMGIPAALLAGYGRHRRRQGAAWTADDIRQAELPLLATLPRRPVAGEDDAVGVSEEIRLLRTAVLARLEGQGGQSLLVAGATPQAGRTTVALGLAASLAQGGKKVLLIEADLRAPSLGRRLGLPDGPGLVDLLAAQVEDEQVIQPVGPDGLRLLRAGYVIQPDQEAEWLADGVFAGNLNRWRERYDYVIIDSPAMAAVADALILARLADQCILVARQGRCRRADVRETIRLLRQSARGVLGMVLVTAN